MSQGNIIELKPFLKKQEARQELRHNFLKRLDEYLDENGFADCDDINVRHSAKERRVPYMVQQRLPEHSQGIHAKKHSLIITPQYKSKTARFVSDIALVWEKAGTSLCKSFNTDALILAQMKKFYDKLIGNGFYPAFFSQEGFKIEFTKKDACIYAPKGIQEVSLEWALREMEEKGVGRQEYIIIDETGLKPLQ